MDSGKILDEIGKSSELEQNADFSIGDTVIVYFTIQEGEKEVQQKFKGIVIADKGKKINRNITIRDIRQGVGVERVFPLSSPAISKIEVIKKGEVSKAKLYHIRELKGKAATNIQEKKFVSKSEEEEQ